MKLDEADLKKILENLYDGFCLVSPERRITYWNVGAEKITGYIRSEAEGSDCRQILAHCDSMGRDICEEACPVAETLKAEKMRELVAFIRHKDGYRLPVAMRVIPVNEGGDGAAAAAIIFSDVASRVVHIRKFERVQKMLRRDTAADLENKRDIEISLHARFDELQRYGRSFGVFFVNAALPQVHDFKEQEEHDRVFRMVGMTLLNSVRSTDVVGRWSGNELITVVGEVDVQNLRRIALRSLALIEQSGIQEEGQLIKADVAIGATIAQPKDTVFTLLKRAENLTRQSREGSGGSRLVIDAEEV